MTYMLCRNRVADFARWKAVFDSHETAHQDAGLRLAGIWRSVEEPNNVFFMFEVTSMQKAREFISAPPAQDAADDMGIRSIVDHQGGEKNAQDLDPYIKERLQYILTHMDKTDDGRRALEKFGARRFIVTIDHDYSDLDNMIKEMNLDLSAYSCREE